MLSTFEAHTNTFFALLLFFWGDNKVDISLIQVRGLLPRDLSKQLRTVSLSVKFICAVLVQYFALHVTSTYTLLMFLCLCLHLFDIQ